MQSNTGFISMQDMIAICEGDEDAARELIGEADFRKGKNTRACICNMRSHTHTTHLYAYTPPRSQTTRLLSTSSDK